MIVETDKKIKDLQDEINAMYKTRPENRHVDWWEKYKKLTLQETELLLQRQNTFNEVGIYMKGNENKR
jgi:hypothetical protein